METVSSTNSVDTADGEVLQVAPRQAGSYPHTEADHTMTTTSPLVGLVSGCAGAVALVYVGQPLDTIKVRMQLSTASKVVASSGGVGHVSMWGCVRDMWRQALVVPAPRPGQLVNTTTAVGGVVEACSIPSSTTGSKGAAAARMARLMYAGTAPALLANVAENGVLFAAYGPCQRLVAFAVDLLGGTTGVEDGDKKLGPAGMATAGSLASLCSAFALCPTELIKVRLQAADLERSNTLVGNSGGGDGGGGLAAKQQRPPVAGTLQVVARVWTEEGGLRGMYRGLGSTVAREMPGYYVFFLAYEASRTYLNKWHYRGMVTAADPVDPTWVTMTAGAAAGMCLWLVVYPVDAVKSRIQATGGAGECSSSGNFLKAMMRSVRNEGPLALYRGLAPTLLRTVPASAVMFWTVERTNTLLTGYGL